MIFSVFQDDDGDISLGFENFEWHTHADMLTSLSGLPEEKAVCRFVDDLLSNKATIAISYLDNKIVSAWITDDPTGELKYKQNNENLEFRYWNGQKLKIEHEP